MYLGLPLGASRITRSGSQPVFDEGEAILHGGAEEPPTSCSASTASLIIASVTVATIGMVVAWRLFGVELGPHPLAGPPGARPRADRARAVPLPRLAQQVVVRRPQPPAVHASSAGRSPRPAGGSTARSSTAPSTPSATATVDAGRGLRQVQTGRVQNYALGIAIGLIVMAGSYLVLAGR